MPNIKLTADDRATVEQLKRALQDQADALQALLDEGYSRPLGDTLYDGCGCAEYRPVRSVEFFWMLDSLRRGRYEREAALAAEIAEQVASGPGGWLEGHAADCGCAGCGAEEEFAMGGRLGRPIK